MRKRTTEEAREYMRRYRAQQRGATHGATSDAEGVTAADKTPVSQVLDTSSAAATDWRAKLLAAPNDDCAGCGHDRQSFHLDGSCRAPMPHTKGRRCGCETFIDPAEPF